MLINKGNNKFFGKDTLFIQDYKKKDEKLC